MAPPRMSSVGFKLPLDWRAMQDRGDLPTVEGPVYEFLRGLGFRHVELGFGLGLGGNRETLDLLEREARACGEAGLGAAIHPGTDREENDRAAWFGSEPSGQPGVAPVLEAAMLAAEASGGRVVCVLHPAQYVYEPGRSDLTALRRDLVRRSRLFFAELARRTAEAEPPVTPVAEHQLPPDPGEPLMRIGDNCRELLEVVGEDGPDICWDLGHYILRVDRYGQPEPPARQFLARVRHVHLHDVVDGSDHRPITAGSTRVKALIECLLGAGFDGTITLEYAAEGIRAAGGVERALRRSVDLLGEWLG